MCAITTPHPCWSAMHSWMGGLLGIPFLNNAKEKGRKTTLFSNSMPYCPYSPTGTGLLQVSPYIIE